MDINNFLGYKEQVLETLVLLAVYFIIKYITNKVISGVGRKFEYAKERVRMLQKIVNGNLFMILIGISLFIWGVERGQIVYFATSLLALIGIAFFAQWSIISNITSTVIIYFSHPVRVGDIISILDKDYQIEGRIVDIGIFFMTIKTEDKEEITLPSNIFMQKMVKKIRVDQ